MFRCLEEDHEGWKQFPLLIKSLELIGKHEVSKTPQNYFTLIIFATGTIKNVSNFSSLLSQRVFKKRRSTCL